MGYKQITFNYAPDGNKHILYSDVNDKLNSYDTVTKEHNPVILEAFPDKYFVGIETSYQEGLMIAIEVNNLKPYKVVYNSSSKSYSLSTSAIDSPDVFLNYKVRS